MTAVVCNTKPPPGAAPAGTKNTLTNGSLLPVRKPSICASLAADTTRSRQRGTTPTCISSSPSSASALFIDLPEKVPFFTPVFFSNG